MPRLSQEAKQNKMKYDRRYNNENIVMKHVMFNKKIEEQMQLLEFLNQQGDVSPYLRGLIKQDMERRNAENV